MKKALLFLGALAAAISPSCRKQDTITTPDTIVEAVFEVGGYAVGTFPTKGMADVIEATLPTSLLLTLTNTATQAQYTTETGEPINIPVGTYSVTACNDPEATQEIAGTALFLSHTPRVRIDTEVQVVAGVGAYSLTATYESVALVTLSAEVSSWTGATSGQVGFTVDAIESGVYRWTFLTGNIRDKKFITTLAPAGGGRSRNFTIVGNESLLMNYDDALLVSPGHWYILHPSDNVTQSGGFSVEFPEWTQGN